MDDPNPPPWHNAYPCYDPKGDHSHDERLWAAVELYAATGDVKFHDYFVQRHCPRFRRWGEGLSLRLAPALLPFLWAAGGA